MLVSLSVNLMIGTLALFIGSIEEQIPDLRNSQLSLFSRIESLTSGKYTSKSMSEFTKLRPVAQLPNTTTFASG
jgi:hypothetical protein